MKKQFAAAALSVILTACLPGIDPGLVPDTGKGQVVVWLSGTAPDPGAGRTLLPDWNGADPDGWIKTLRFTKPGEDPVIRQADPDTPFLRLELKVGTWTLTTAAYNGEIAEANRIAEQIQTIEVIPGELRVSIVLEPIQSGGEGVFEWNINLPMNESMPPDGSAFSKLLDTVIITLREQNSRTEETIMVAEKGEAAAGTVRTGNVLSGIRANLPAGVYLVFLTACLNDDRSRGLTEAAYVFAGFTTTLDFTFTTDDFPAAAPLAGTFAITSDSPVVNIIVTPYRDEAMTKSIGPAMKSPPAVLSDIENVYTGGWYTKAPYGKAVITIYFGVEAVLEGSEKVNVDLDDNPAPFFTGVLPANGIWNAARLVGTVVPNSGGPPRYTVTFESNDGSPVPSQTVAAGGTLDPAGPLGVTKPGYILDGWYRDPAFAAGTRWDFDDPITEDITLYAKWNSNSQTYTVSFDPAGGSPTPEPQHIAYNGLVTAPTGVAKAGYQLEGWYWGMEGLEIKWDFAVQPVWFDLVLYAKWTVEYYKVDFAANGGSPAPEPQNIACNQHAAPPGMMTKPGFAFDGWYRDPAFKGAPWNFAANVITGPTTLYARWNQSGGISFDFGKGLEDENTSINSSAGVISWRENTPVTFTVSGNWPVIEWYLDGGKIDGETGANLTLYAGDLGIKTHTVTARVYTGVVWYSKTVAFTVTL
jgi:uncharacterized repeat protein (TIGR02543 family)